MIRFILLAFLVLISITPLLAQKLIISGTVRDQANGELLMGATISAYY
jgi:hypothetical protein